MSLQLVITIDGISRQDPDPAQDTSGLDMESSDLEWTNADLFFLVDTLRHGIPVDRVAGFLNRSETEVRASTGTQGLHRGQPRAKKNGVRSVSDLSCSLLKRGRLYVEIFALASKFCQHCNPQRHRLSFT